MGGRKWNAARCAKGSPARIGRGYKKREVLVMLDKPLSALKFYQQRPTWARFAPSEVPWESFMDFAEEYADYILAFEKRQRRKKRTPRPPKFKKTLRRQGPYIKDPI